MKRKIINTLIIILTISVIIELHIYTSNNNKNNKVLEEVQTKETFEDKEKTLSIMVQGEDGSYSPSLDRSSWPDVNTYKYYKSECSDNNGVIIPSEEMITYQDKTINIKTNKTIYCTLYFRNIKFSLLWNYLKENDKNNTLQSTEVDGLYRYKGTASQVTNNYICLGSTTTDKCQDGDNMYRIIGVTATGQLKVIMAKSKEKKAWDSRWNMEVKWNDSELYTYLNGTFYSSLNSRIKELVEYYIWNMECSSSWPANNKFPIEGTVQAHIGLMYVSDYANAFKNGDLNNWIFITNGWAENTAENELTMTRWGYSTTYNNYSLYYVPSTTGSPAGGGTAGQAIIRPVFYLTPNITLTGDGSTTDPFRITTMNNA